VKQQCYVATIMLVTKLEGHFVKFQLMNALGIVYPQFCMQFYVDLSFSLHFNVINKHYCEKIK
jgi:hypothetical protein